MKWQLVVFGLSAMATACGDARDATLAQAQTTALTADCDYSGTWAMKFEIPVRWPATLAVETGQGTVYQWSKTVRTHSGDTLQDTLQVCGMKTPDTQARDVFHHERYGITFPDEVFESGVLPTTPVTTHLAADKQSFTTDPLVILLGLNMDNPVQAVWPSRANQIQAVDADNDGNPGLTLSSTTAQGYSQPPVNMFRSKRAAKFHVAIRNAVQGVAGSFGSCDAASGTVTIPVIAGKAAVNSRIIGCQRVDGPTCSPSEYELIDKLQSGYDLAGTATLKMVRIDPSTSCAAIRAMAF